MAASSVDKYNGSWGIEFQPNFSFCSTTGIEAVSASRSGVVSAFAAAARPVSSRWGSALGGGFCRRGSERMGIEDQPRAGAGTDRPGDPAGRRQAVDPSRRSLLTAGSALLMTGGLVGGYGTFLAMAGRYLFPGDRNKAWVFVSDPHGIAPGASKAFVSPTGSTSCRQSSEISFTG